MYGALLLALNLNNFAHQFASLALCASICIFHSKVFKPFIFYIQNETVQILRCKFKLMPSVFFLIHIDTPHIAMTSSKQQQSENATRFFFCIQRPTETQQLFHFLAIIEFIQNKKFIFTTIPSGELSKRMCTECGCSGC